MITIDYRWVGGVQKELNLDYVIYGRSHYKFDFSNVSVHYYLRHLNHISKNWKGVFVLHVRLILRSVSSTISC